MSFTINIINLGRGLEEGTYVYRSETPIPDTPLPAPIGTIPKGGNQFVDTTAVYGKMYYYRFGTYLGSDVILTKNRALRVVAPADTGPGPQTLVAGDWRLGFFGWVSSAEFMGYSALATRYGLTAAPGDAGWLKVAREGKVLFLAHGPVSLSVPYQTLYNKGLVYGTNDTGLCVPTGSTPTNQYIPFSPDGNFNYIPRLMVAHPTGSDLLNSLSAGANSAAISGDATVPTDPQTKGTEFDELVAVFNSRPLYIGDVNTCRFGMFAYDFYKTGTGGASSDSRQTDLCPQPSGTVDKSKTNTRGFIYGGGAASVAYDYLRPAMHAISQIAVTAATITDAQLGMTSNYVSQACWRPILELEL